MKEAVDAFKKALRLKADYPEAHNNLGNALKDQGRLDEALDAYLSALRLKPDYAEAHNNLGIALKDQGRWNESVASFRSALQFKPDYAEAHYNLGIALMKQGRLDEAIEAYHSALRLKPDYAEALNNLGMTFKEQGRLDEAADSYRSALRFNPHYAETHNNLGNVLKDQGRLDEAVDAYRCALQLKPNFAEAHNNLGNALAEMGRRDEAIAAYRSALQLKRDYAEAHNNLGNVLREQGRLDEANASYRSALKFRPQYAAAHNNMGIAFKEQGRLDASLAAYRTALELKPDYVVAHSNLLFTLHYHPDYDAQAIAEEHRQWNRRHAEPFKRFTQPHRNDRAPERRLRIGYVSPDLREHPVGRFLLPLLEEHNRQHFEIYAYAQVPVADALTKKLRSLVNGWRSTVGLTDQQVAEQIRKDGIDILVDLAMHTADNRLLVFAYKPAPVQATYLAYVSSTGMDAVDYRISDPYLDPQGMDESAYSEKTLRLPETYWCYKVFRNTPEVAQSPVLASQHVTFGCLNNFCKVNKSTLGVWAELLRKVPGSRLLLHAREGSHRQQVLDFMAQEGVEAARVQFAGSVPAEAYFELYHSIDIALDTFPYGGAQQPVTPCGWECRWSP